jgi:tripartite ATP-independent transporter DctM subunit|tara:strand:- start:2357 stop:3730 length:1374 start_codon:yes stop_codon:yes gene_type:complete
MLAIAMLACMIGGIFIGIPVAFTLIFLALGFGYISMGENVFDLAYYNLIGGLSDEVFMAIPMFIFMGYIAERAGLVDGLFDTLKDILSSVKGSLYYVVIVIAILISLATGVVGASVTLLGIMAAPHMIRLGYNAKLSAGVIAAGGSMIIIPPSVPLIVMAPTLNVPIIDLYAAVIVPGLLIAMMFICYVAYQVYREPGLAPAVEHQPIPLKLYGKLIVDVFPLAFLIAVTLGSMLFGLATSTEAGAFGAFGALILALANRSLSVERLQEALLKTTNTSAVVMLLAIASTIFGAIFTGLGGDHIIVNTLNSLPIPSWALVGTILVLCHILGWPFEWPVVVLVFVPMFLPILLDANIDMLWFGAALGIVIQTAYLTPPVALTSYYLKQVVPQWDLTMIFKSMMPFMWIQVLAVCILFITPGLATWLPEFFATARQEINKNITDEKAVGEIDFISKFKSN